MAEDLNLSKLTPEEFAEFYMAGLKKELGMYSLQANKVGFLGYLVNILGNVTYDAKVYRDFLFKEAFPATAQQDENIFLHSAVYGYNINLATPSTAVGTITFDFSFLPTVSTNVVRREVVFGNKIPMIEIKVGDVTFSSDSQYTFIKEGDAYKTIISRFDGSVSVVPSNSAILTVPLDNFKQEKPEIISFELPPYAYGSYYTYTFDVENGEFLSEVTVNIREQNQTQTSRYETVRSKYLVGATDKKIFLTQKSETSYQIEFGSGVHGKWVPGASVTMYLYKTLAASGNFSQNVKSEVEAPISLIVYNIDTAGTVSSTTISPENLTINFKYSEGGIDPLTGEYLRKALVNFIQTRDNFISETDHYNIIEKYTTDFRLLFKKMVIQDNVFYLQRALRDDYQVPIRSLNVMPICFDENQKFEDVHFGVRDAGTMTSDVYYYVVRAFDLFKNTLSTGEIIIPVTATVGGEVTLEWAPVPGAVKYIVYGRSPLYDYMWETTSTRIVDDGTTNTGAIIRGVSGLPEIEKEPYILYPELEYAGTKFTSPFLYKYNSVYNHYEGWLFYEDMIINFKSVTQVNQDIDPTNKITAATIPSIYMNLIYNETKEETTISIKSYQRLDDVDIGGGVKEEWKFYITIPEFNIDDKLMTPVDESTHSYVYSENHGFIVDPIQAITIVGKVGGTQIFEAKTPRISQRHDITDQLQIPRYKHDGIRYLIDVPVIASDIFKPNKSYYLDKIMEFLYGFNFEENRMVSDNLEFRFLNTDSVRSFLLLNALVQGKKLFKNTQYIENVHPISIAETPDNTPTDKQCWIIGGVEIPIDSTRIDGAALDIYKEKGFGGLFDVSTYATTSPYSILVRGDQTAHIQPPHVIVIKGAATVGVNGHYHVLSVNYDDLADMTTIYTIEKINISSTEGSLYYAYYDPWKLSGPDNFARWNDIDCNWEFSDVNIGDIVTVKSPILTTYIYTSGYEYVEYTLKLPLNMRLKIFVDKDAVSQYEIDLEEERKKIILEVAKFLQMYMSGTDICYYPSTIIDYVTEPRRVWVKGVIVYTTDSTYPVQNEFRNGIETRSEDKIRELIGSSKIDMLKYTSSFYWWDVDNIKIDYEFNG